MASTFKKKQKRNFIVAIVCSVLVFALIAAAVVVNLVHRASPYEKFSDKGFASAIAEELGYKSYYSLSQSDLDQYEGLIYTWNVGVDENNKYASYAYPVVLLCDKYYTDYLIEESDPNHEHGDHEEAEDTEELASHCLTVPYLFNDPADLNMFANLRVLRVFDPVELSQISSGCQMTQIYTMYGLSTQAYTIDQILSAGRLSKLTDLTQISGLKNLEQLSISYTGVTTLNGLENFPNLNKLDATYTALTDISALEGMDSLTYLGLNSINVTPEEEDEEEDKKDEDKKDEDKKEDEKEDEPTFNTTGLTAEQLKVISGLKNLVYLDVTNNNVSDLSFLSELTAIKYLAVAGNPLTNLDGVANTKDLKVVYANGCLLENVDALAGHTKLETLQLQQNKLTNLNGLSDSKAVVSLNASENELEDASPLSGMADIESVNLSGNKLTVIPDLSGLKKVSSLNLSNNELEDASGLAKFNPTAHELEKDKDGKEIAATVTVNLSGNNLTTITMTASKVTSLDLSKNKLGKHVDGNPLSFEGCTGLTTLTISDNTYLKKLDGIEKLTGLTTLNASHIGANELCAMKDMKNLKTVDLSKCEVLLNVNGLADCPALETLTLDECARLNDLSVLAKLPKLATLSIKKCVSLNDESITNAFGTPKNGDTKAELKLDKDTKLTVDLTDCTGIKNFKIFDEYGNMKVTGIPKDTEKK